MVTLLFHQKVDVVNWVFEEGLYISVLSRNTIKFFLNQVKCNLTKLTNNKCAVSCHSGQRFLAGVGAHGWLARIASHRSCIPSGGVGAG